MRNPPFHPATSPLVLAAFPPGHPVPPGTTDPACNMKRTTVGSNDAANAEASPASWTPGETVRHVSGPPTGADSTYMGTVVDGPLEVDPGTVGMCVDCVTGAGDGALEGGVVEGITEGLGVPEGLWVDGDVTDGLELFLIDAEVSEWPVEHPASAKATAAIVAVVMRLPLKGLLTRDHSRCSSEVNAK